MVLLWNCRTFFFTLRRKYCNIVIILWCFCCSPKKLPSFLFEYIFRHCHVSVIIMSHNKSVTKSWQCHSLYITITFDWLAQKCYKNMTMSPLMNVHYILWVATTVSQNISWQCHYICYKKCKEECLVIFYPFAISSQNHDNVTNLQKEVNSFIVRKATIVPLFRLGDTFVATQEFR